MQEHTDAMTDQLFQAFTHTPQAISQLYAEPSLVVSSFYGVPDACLSHPHEHFAELSKFLDSVTLSLADLPNHRVEAESCQHRLMHIWQQGQDSIARARCAPFFGLAYRVGS